VPRPSSYWPPPSRWFPYKPSHALYTFEPLLTLVNTKVTADNYAQLVFGGAMYSQQDSLRLMNVQDSSLGGQPPALGSERLRSHDREPARQRTDQATFVLSWNGAVPHFQKLGFTNPDPNSLILFREGSLPPARCDRVSMGAVVQLQSALLRGLQRYLFDAEDPLIDPATAKLDFVIGARLPCADARGSIDSRPEFRAGDVIEISVTLENRSGKAVQVPATLSVAEGTARFRVLDQKGVAGADPVPHQSPAHMMTLEPGARATLTILLNGRGGYRLVRPGDYHVMLLGASLGVGDSNTLTLRIRP